MQSKYTYSIRAEHDVKKIYLDTAIKWGMAQADKYNDGLEHSINLIAGNPDLGRQCDYIRKEYHRHEYERHIIFYRKRKQDILIVRIIYDAMDIKKRLST
ncbi:MAG: type II toxin-antitoxin system RelE/ParE family toxin [gamma proteobacterium symbiont of Taylorina sp.]|nr:type II toxin-antitoxin system RelE/ParE family toxin [gamma proteobacterium symbiont of Taylorina sp.]